MPQHAAYLLVFHSTRHLRAIKSVHNSYNIRAYQEHPGRPKLHWNHRVSLNFPPDPIADSRLDIFIMHFALLAYPTIVVAVTARILPNFPFQAVFSPLEPRQISPDGSCGGSNQYTCSAGNCCSQFGFWYEAACHPFAALLFVPSADPNRSIFNSGSSSSFCGNGCQSTFGSCGTLSPPPPDGSCGSAQNVTCQNGLCYSENGF